ncbi:MAG: hypothetical protein QM744_04730 [Mesorhizobium sp.]
MENYSFWQDFFATYRSSSDAIKALWIVAPLAFIIALVWILLRSSAGKRTQCGQLSRVLENSGFENSVRRKSDG